MMRKMRATQALLQMYLVGLVTLLCVVSQVSSGSTQDELKPKNEDSNTAVDLIGFEPKLGDKNLVKDIVDRLHALDADIGKLMYNSTSMYAPNEEPVPSPERGGEKFTEVLNDLDSLQDEIGGLVANATKTRQYNILVRLRPLNNILYRIRHNLHLMRNSLVAINTVARLEKIGNNVLDSTLQVFMRPDATLNEEFGDSGKYDINLDKNESSTFTNSSPVIPAETAAPNLLRSSTSETEAPSTRASTTASPTSTTTTTTTTTVAPTITKTVEFSSSTSTTKKPNQKASTRRSNNRQSQRRNTTQKPTTPKTE